MIPLLPPRPKHVVLLLIIFITAANTRFWNLSALFHWTLDEEFWAYVSHNIATGLHLPLIGGPIGGTGVNTGPLFVWLVSSVLFLTHSNPLGLAVAVSTLGVISSLLVFVVAKTRFKRQTAFIAAFLYSSSTLAVLYDRKFWNASLAVLLSLITLLLVHRLRRHPTGPKAILLGLVIALGLHAHMTGLVLLVFALVASLVYRFPAKTVFVTVTTFLLLQTPLLAFDLRHNFQNTTALINLFTNRKSPGTESVALTDTLRLSLNTFSRLIYTPATDVSDELTLCPQLANARSVPPKSYSILAVSVIAYSLYTLKRKNPFALLLFLNILLVLVYSKLAPDSFYPGQLSEYFFLPSFAGFIVLLASLISKIFSQEPRLGFALAVFLVVINLHTVFNLTHSHGFSSKKTTVDHLIVLVKNQPFSLEVSGHPCQIYGYRFLLTQQGKEPTASYLDPVLGWLYQERLPAADPQISVKIDADSATIQTHALPSLQ